MVVYRGKMGRNAILNIEELLCFCVYAFMLLYVCTFVLWRFGVDSV